MQRFNYDVTADPHMALLWQMKLWKWKLARPDCKQPANELFSLKKNRCAILGYDAEEGGFISSFSYIFISPS